MLITVLFLVFCTAGVVGFAVVPMMYGRAAVITEKRQQKMTNKMGQLMTKDQMRNLNRLFLLAPVLCAAGLYLLFPSEFKLLGVVVGAAAGLVLPGFYVQILTRKSRDKFSDQLVDALMIMSSSFRGGLSLIQALEAVVDEMPDPINKEFGTVLGENKMGVSLEEALNHMYDRMPSSALQQMITAILLARETGGNLPAIFNRIVTNIRETKKIQQNINTLTVQGKIQGFVMSLLPIAFGFIVYTSNRRVFEHMFTSDLGRALLIYALISQLIGTFLIWKISTYRDY